MAEEEKEHGGKEHGKGHGGGGGGHGKGHGGGGHEEGHEGAPEWLISFADNTALMMGFFVILLALNMGPKGGGNSSSSQHESQAAKESGQSVEALDWALSVRAGFNNPVKLDSTHPGDQILVKRLREKMMTESEDRGLPGDKNKSQSIRPSDYHGMSGSLAFDDRSSQLNEESEEKLNVIAQKIRGLRLVIEVRGHVSAAEAYNEPDQGMRLSFDRALTVSKALAKQGVDWRNLRVIANGDNDRVELQAYEVRQQRQNQRVEIIVTNEAPPSFPPSLPPSSSAIPSLNSSTPAESPAASHVGH